MPISAVGSSAATSPNAGLNMQSFLQVLMAQLNYQNPLKPMDNQEFLAQIAQFTALGQTQEMNSNLQTMVSNQAAQQSIGLIGHTVNLTTASGAQTGQVTRIDLSGATPMLTVTTSSGVLTGISLSQITSVQ